LKQLGTANNNVKENEEKIKLMKDEISQLKDIVKISTQPVALSTQQLLPLEHESSARYFSHPVQQPYVNLQGNHPNFTTYKSVPNLPRQRAYPPAYSHAVHIGTQPNTPATTSRVKLAPRSYQQSVIPSCDQQSQELRDFTEQESPVPPKQWHANTERQTYSEPEGKPVSPAYFEKYDENVKNRLRAQTDLEKRFDKLQKKASNFLKNQTSLAQKPTLSPKKEKILRENSRHFGSHLNNKRGTSQAQFQDSFNAIESNLNFNDSSELESTLVLEEKLAQIREERMVVQKELNARNEDWLATTRQEMESQLRSTMEKRVREEVQSRIQNLQKEDAGSRNRTRIDDSDTTNLTQNTTLSTANTTGRSKTTDEATFSTATGTLKSIPLLSPVSPNLGARKLKMEQLSKPLSRLNDGQRVQWNPNSDLDVIREETGSRHGSNQGLVMSDLEAKKPPRIVKSSKSQVDVKLFPERASNPKHVHVESREQVATEENETLNFGLSSVRSKSSVSKESVESRSSEVLDPNLRNSDTSNPITVPIEEKVEGQHMELSPESFDFDRDEEIAPEPIAQQEEDDGDSLLNAYRLRTETLQHVSDEESDEAF